MNAPTPALRASLADIVAEYEAKRAGLSDLEVGLTKAARACEMGCQIGGQFGGSIWGRGGPPSVRGAEQALRSSAWKHVYHGLNIHLLATASERSRFERELDDPPEFTIENIRATFGRYVSDPRGAILKGLAEVFVSLDPAYKSHSKVRIGVKGLPKRVIVGGAGGGDARYGTYGPNRLRDLINALLVYRGKPHIKPHTFHRLHRRAIKRGETSLFPGLTLRAFRNGNMHVLFDARTCRDINRALAEFYGEVLPDAEEPGARKRAGTAVSADLAYYPTPEAVAHKAVSELMLRHGEGRVLEPQCGCGRLLDATRETYPDAILRGVEVHPGRAAEARAKGHAVQVANFLSLPPDPSFDAVLMNPPFCGRHWRKHLDHAARFIRPEGGQIVAILPATAWYDGHLSDLCDRWFDLPVASFAESGTNVPTGIFTMKVGR